MTTITNLTVATGGRVWTAPTKSQQSPERAFLLMAIAMALLILVMMVWFPVYFNSLLKVTNSTSEKLTLQNHVLGNTEAAVETTKDWLPTALNVNSDDIAETNLTNLSDGTVGSITLKDGTNIPFTIHTEDDNELDTITVEKTKQP